MGLSVHRVFLIFMIRVLLRTMLSFQYIKATMERSIFITLYLINHATAILQYRTHQKKLFVNTLSFNKTGECDSENYYSTIKRRNINNFTIFDIFSLILELC